MKNSQIIEDIKSKGNISLEKIVNILKQNYVDKNVALNLIRIHLNYEYKEIISCLDYIYGDSFNNPFNKDCH